LKARQAADAHAMLKRAADIQGGALVDFVATAARHMIDDADMIRLSLADQERFAQALLDPSALAPAMQRAFERHRRLVGPT
jgi:uncharacterized protein (DUF1778 family)